MTLRTAIATAAVAVVGCASQPKTIDPPVEPPQAFARAGGASVQPDSWWTAFGDPELDRLVDRALESNLDLATAWYRLREARAIARREKAPLIPEVSGFADAEVRRPEPPDADYVRLGLSAEYELDLWGRLRSRAAAEAYRARASLADYRTVALSVAGEVAITWFQLVEARSQLELLAEQVEANGKVLTLLESRFGSGQIRSVDILRQRQLIEATRAQQLAAEARLAVLHHQLAVLLGRPPGAEVGAPGTELPELPPVPATGLPSELIRRRPDVRRAHDLLLAADRDLAAAVSNRYPRLSLSASIGTAHGTASDLFRNWFAQLAANLLAPLIDGGERAAEVDRTEAVKRQRLYEYGQTALLAFREVEDALVQEEKQRARITSLEQQVTIANQAYEQLRIEYLNGLADYIDVLTALTAEQQLRRDLLAARRAALEFRVALYRALAGSFETPRESE